MTPVNPSSICILRLSALGDVTHVLPMISALRQRYPDMALTWVCGKLEYRLLQHIEGIRFIVFDKKRGLKGYLALRRALAGERFDVLLHMQVAARANIASLCIRARHRIGWDRANSRDLHHLFIDQEIASVAQRHQVDAFLAFAAALGAETDEPVWALPVLPESVQWVDERIDADARVLLISPCSSHVLRNWSVEGYAAVADHAAAEGYQVVLCGGPSELETSTADAIAERMTATPLNLVGQDTLQQLIALLQRADVVITPDSGPAHIANAVGTDVIGLHACTNPQRSGPYGSLHLCVDRFPEAVEKFSDVPRERMRWNSKIEKPGVMDLITIDEVIARIDSLG